MLHEQTALFVVRGDGVHDIKDYSFLASDRPAFQCVGRPLTIKGPRGEEVVKWPCGRILPDHCFIPRLCIRSRDGKRPVRSKCVACEQEIRETRKGLWIYLEKARTAMGHHMVRERAQGLHTIRDMATYEVATGLPVARLADEMEEAATRNLPCPHCEVRWSEMKGGWELQMSLDRTDPKRMLAADNHMLKCRTGNSQRGAPDPRVAATRDAYWRLIRRERASGA